MRNSTYDCELDTHCQMMIDEYRNNCDDYEKIREQAGQILCNELQKNNLYVTAIESRIKEESSLAKKLALKGAKYSTITDLTDIVGLRIITFYNEDVDRVASYVEKLFEVDWSNSVDKRKMHQLDSFGYDSLHYICRLPKALFYDQHHPQVNEIRFEIQMRSALQHVWATMYHDTGYKSDVEVPTEYLRMLNRLAGLLELADDEFSRMHKELSAYRRQIQALVSNGDLSNIALNGDTFKSYLSLSPFQKLTDRIADINQAEIQQLPLMPFLPLLRELGLQTLGDVDAFIKNNQEDAYKISLSQLAETDIDIISSTVGLQNLCIAAVLKNGGGKAGLKHLYDIINGESASNESLADMVYEQVSKLPFMNKL